jgi:hypothetical protein
MPSKLNMSKKKVDNLVLPTAFPFVAMLCLEAVTVQNLQDKLPLVLRAARGEQGCVSHGRRHNGLHEPAHGGRHGRKQQEPARSAPESHPAHTTKLLPSGHRNVVPIDRCGNGKVPISSVPATKNFLKRGPACMF